MNAQWRTTSRLRFAADVPPAPIVFTDSAAGKVKELVDEEGNPS